MPAFVIDTSRPFFLLRRKNEAGVTLCTGQIVKHRQLSEIPRSEGVPAEETLDTVSLVPFSQARERGWPVHDAGEPIVTLVIENASVHPLDEVLDAIPRRPVKIQNLAFDTTSEQYEETIRRIIEDEIGTGQGANFVIARRCDASLEDFSVDTVLSVFRSLLVQEFGTYWTFVLFDGERFVLGATPERHISARSGDVMMNPISGTFRKDDSSPSERPAQFLQFLQDEKEVYELFMVTDEELKIMCEVCDRGGEIVGPLLKEMSRLVHTEYLLLGRSGRDAVDLLRQSMFAPTVTGSPVLSAFRVIERYEQESRGYYGATIALIGRSPDGSSTLDAPITIRTLEIGADGRLVIRVGATLVRGSDPASEVKETEAKIAGVLNAIRAAGDGPTAPVRLLEAVDPEQVQILLQRRNLYLSRFWFEPQSANYNAVPELQDCTVIIIDAEDAFSNMLKRMVAQMGAQVQVVGFDAFDETAPADIVIAGPGPGDPTSTSDRKMVRLREILDGLRARRQPFLAECLSHQILCGQLGFPIISKQVPFQGAQAVIDLFGKSERVGFYNTFAGVASTSVSDVEIAADPDSREIHALRGETFYSCQFHPESILTPRGYELIRDALVELRARAR